MNLLFTILVLVFLAGLYLFGALLFACVAVIHPFPAILLVIGWTLLWIKLFRRRPRHLAFPPGTFIAGEGI